MVDGQTGVVLAKASGLFIHRLGGEMGMVLPPSLAESKSSGSGGGSGSSGAVDNKGSGGSDAADLGAAGGGAGGSDDVSNRGCIENGTASTPKTALASLIVKQQQQGQPRTWVLDNARVNAGLHAAVRSSKSSTEGSYRPVKMHDGSPTQECAR